MNFDLCLSKRNCPAYKLHFIKGDIVDCRDEKFFAKVILRKLKIRNNFSPFFCIFVYHLDRYSFQKWPFLVFWWANEPIILLTVDQTAFEGLSRKQIVGNCVPPLNSCHLLPNTFPSEEIFLLKLRAGFTFIIFHLHCGALILNWLHLTLEQRPYPIGSL